MTIMLYKYPGEHEIDHDFYDWQIIDESQVEALAVDGWELSPKAAKEAYESRPLTRDELEIKAKDLGIKFDGRTSDQKLESLIISKMTE